MNNNSQDWYFQKDSDVLFIDEDMQRVGILNSNPDYTLDINGNISASNILGLNANIPFIQNELLLGDVVNAQSNITDYIQATIGDIEHVDCVSLNAMSNVVVGSNLAILNTYLNQECPIPQQGSIFGYSLGGGWIDPSWIKTDNDFGETLSSLWDLFQSGYDLFNFAQSVLKPNDGGLGDELKNTLDDALDGGDSNDTGKLYVDWGNVKHKPIYADKLTNNVAIKGNLYLNEAQSIYSVNSSYLTVGNNLNLDLTSTSNASKILDVGTHDAFLHDVTASNIIVTSNLQSTEINADDIITNTLSGNSIRVGDFYVRSDGIFYGNPDIPLESKQIINSVGDFIGTVNKSQIIDLEAFNLAALADGTLVFGSFGETNILNDPFNFVSTPLFSVS